MTLIDTDRWMEMELGWFRPATFHQQAQELLARLAPLWNTVQGHRGIIFSCGLRVTLVALWSGDFNQPLPVSGNRYASWAGATYGDLRDCLRMLHDLARDMGLGDLKLGIMFTGGGVHVGGMVATGDPLYEDQDPAWYLRHSECYMGSEGSGALDSLAPMRPDSHRYASRPGGIGQGETFARFFGEQWGAFSRDMGMEAIVLRDAFLGPMLYTRFGPFGLKLPPRPEDIDLWTRRATALFRGVKDGNPQSFVMGYSCALSAVAEWRVGCVDLEAIVAAGAMDAFIDQTWGGAWQDFWSDTMLGWTFQLGNLLVHQAQVEGGNRRRAKPCRHYFLTETWDSWEPWDTLHQVPGKLAWSMWAFSHAALRTGGGLKRPGGVYLSWMNNRFGEILSQKDVAFLGENLDAAQRDAAAMEEVYGPAAVYDRTALEAVTRDCPDANTSDFLDDQVGLLNKYGFGCLCAVRGQDVAACDADGLLWQTPPADTPLPQRGALVAAGRADRIAPELLARAGAELAGGLIPAGYDNLIEIDHQPLVEPIYTAERQGVRATAGEVLAATRQGPLIIAAPDGRAIYWMPQDWWQPGNAVVRKSHLGSLKPYAALCRAFANSLAQHDGRWWIEQADEAQPVCMHLWKSGGTVRILAGNLETCVFGDARLPRTVRLAIQPGQLGLPTDRPLRLVNPAGVVAAGVTEDGVCRFEFIVQPEAYVLLDIVAS